MPDSPYNPPNSLRRALDEGSRRVPDRVRQLPGHAVRVAVIGVGKLLQATETVRSGYGEVRRNGVAPTAERLRRDGLAALRPGIPTQPAARTPETSESPAGDERGAASSPAPAAGRTPAGEHPDAGRPPSAAPSDGAGSAEGAATKQPATSSPEPTPQPAGETASVAGAASEPVPASSEAPPAHDELPVPNYDDATLGSLRGRLRNLTISDLGILLAYERAHQNRTSVVNMFENRILKLEQQQGR